MTQKLFAAYLGGRAPKANTELHDVVFATGARIEDTYEQLLDKWFGNSQGLHLDSWVELDVVDGWQISLSATKSQNGERLFFVNLGAYRKDVFAELHPMGFYVAANAAEAKARARSNLFQGDESEPHVDDLFDIDDCIAIDSVNGLHVTLSRTEKPSSLKLNNGYQPLPEELIAQYMRRHRM